MNRSPATSFCPGRRGRATPRAPGPARFGNGRSAWLGGSRRQESRNEVTKQLSNEGTAREGSPFGRPGCGSPPVGRAAPLPRRSPGGEGLRRAWAMKFVLAFICGRFTLNGRPADDAVVIPLPLRERGRGEGEQRPSPSPGRQGGRPLPSRERHSKTRLPGSRRSRQWTLSHEKTQ